MIKPLRHIRFGVICSNTLLYAWQKIVIEKLIAEADIELKLVVFESDKSSEKNQDSSGYNSFFLSGVLWKLYYQQYVEKKSDALQKLETNMLYEGVPKICCDFVSDNEGFSKLEDDDIEKIEKSQLDFIIDFSSLRLTGNVLSSARYGIWSYQYSDPEKYTGSPSCFWEIYYEDVLTKVSLTRLTIKPDTIIILKEGCLKTEVFYTKNIDKIHLESATWPLNICQDIRNDLANNLSIPSKIKPSKKFISPSSLQLLIFFFIQIKLFVKKVCKQLFYTDYWNIGIVFSPIHEFLNSEKTHTVQWFSKLPKSRFMADPFGVYIKDQLHILYEDFRFDEGIGKTASFLFKEDTFVENRIVIDEEFHMSYPFLFEHKDEMYCIPETYQANQVGLYKAVDFPIKWKFEKILIKNYAGIDSTLYNKDDTWFLFSTDKNSGPHYNLNIHYTDDVFGPWKAHPKNPVKTDIRSARPAGTLFEHKGELFRPSMDYSEKIEGRITINKVVTLTILNFKEEVHTIIDPFENTPFCDKVHTLSKIGPYTLVDGAKELFIFSNYYALKYKIKRVLQKLRKK